MPTIIHKIQGINLKKKVNNTPSFLLTNQKGSFFSLPLAHRPLSRFQGLHICTLSDKGWKIHKVIENISPGKTPKELINKPPYIERHYNNALETFFMPKNKEILIYQTENLNHIDISLDIRPIYDFDPLERYYKIHKEPDYILIHYTKNHYNFYLAIAHDDVDPHELEEWSKVEYPTDLKRGTSFASLYIYKALRIYLKLKNKMVFSAGFNKTKVIRNAKEGLKNIKKLKAQAEKQQTQPITTLSKDREIKSAYICATNSINSLITTINNQTGIFAGLPWFFQFWSRDELISLKALILQKNPLAKKIILRWLSQIKKDGRLPNRFPHSDLASADSIGWLFKRISELKFSKKEIKKLTPKLKTAINALLKNYTKNLLVINKPKETWMDTSPDNIDPRDGARIEIQTLTLSAYKLLYNLTKNKKYQKLEQELKLKTQKLFWNHPILADGFTTQPDFTVRPNIFLAYYTYSELLTKEQWTKCFNYSLPKLYLNWKNNLVGISTIDKHDTLFKDTYTGELSESYHRGDSWYFINNITAICLHRLDKKLYKKQIKALLKASTQDILYNGFIAHASELSSAKQFSSQASLCQAWSASTYIELVEEIKKENTKLFV